MYEDDAKDEKKVLGLIGSHPLLVSLSQLAPLTGCSVEYLERKASKSLEEKRKILFDELRKGDIPLTRELIESDEFINRLMIVLHAMESTNQREKIILFARLLRNRDFNSSSGAIFEEQLSILEQLSLHELKILVTLDKYEESTKDNLEYIENSRVHYLIKNSKYFFDFMEEIKNMLSFSSIEDVEGMLSRLTRTGLYEQISLTFPGANRSVGKLTPLYYALKEVIKLNEADFS